MLSDEEELRNIKETQEAYGMVGDYKQLEIVPFDDAGALEFHKYMKTLAQNLLGDEVDLDKENIVFLLSDDKYPNAAYMDYPIAGGKKFIHFSAALFDFIENKDQLGFILGHELQHFMEKMKHGSHANTKLEEEYSDLNSVPKLARAGLNIEEAKHIADKMFTNRNILARHLVDEHLSDTNRKKLLDMWITAERQSLRKQGKAKDDVTGSKTHALEENITSLVHNRPKAKGLRDFFESEKYLNASYEEKVDMWFEKFEERLKLAYDEERKEYYYQQLDELDSKVLEEARLAFGYKNRVSPYNPYFEKRYLETVFKETEYRRIVSKTKILSNAAGISKLHGLCLERDFGDYVKEQFKGFSEADDDRIVTYNLKRGVFKSLLGSETAEKQLIDGKIFELNHDETDVGKHFSQAFMRGLDSFGGDRFVWQSINKETRDIAFYDGGKFYLLDKEGEILTCTGDANKLEALFIAREIDKTAQTLKDIKDGKEIDRDVYLHTLVKAWKIMDTPLSSNDYISKGTRFNNLQTFPTSLSTDTYGGIIIGQTDAAVNMNDVMQCLSDEGKLFCEEMLDRSKPQEQMKFISDTLADEVANKCTTKEITSYTDGIIQGAIISTLENRLEEYEKLTRATLSREDAYFPTTVGEITLVKMIKHLESGKNLDDFEFPFEKEYQAFYDRVENSGDMRRLLGWEMTMFWKCELLKKEPNIDLSQFMIEKGKTSDGSDYEHLLAIVPEMNLVGRSDSLKRYFFDHYEASEVIKQRFKENLNNPKNWGDGSVAEGMENAPFYERIDRITKDMSFMSTCELYDVQDVMLHFYKEAPIDEKISIMTRVVGGTLNKSLERQEYKKVKEKVWNVIKDDFAAKDISLADRIDLFCMADHNDLFDDNKEHYFEVLVGKDGQGGLLKEIEDVSGDKSHLYMKLLYSDYRIPDPGIRSQVISKAVQTWYAEKLSYNDVTADDEQRKWFSSQVSDLRTTHLEDMSVTDRHQFLRELAEITYSQKELSEVIRPDPPQVDTQNKKLIASAYGLDTLTYLMQEKVISRETVMNYFLGAGTPKETKETMVTLLDDFECKCYSQDKKYLYDMYKHLLTEQYLSSAKKEFDAAPLEAKGAIINLLSENNGWEQHFDLVADELFHDAGSLGGMGKKFLKAYISSREGSERCFYLSAMYAAANNKTTTFDDGKSPYTKEQRALAQGLRMFLENSGPAGVKLAQAMSSYADVPDFIRDEMQNAKNNANPPARWEVFDWLKNASEDDALEHGKLGKLLGSASFFVTYDMKDDNGQEKVIKILRQGSKDLADAEFVVYKDMLQKMKDEFDGIESFDRLVNNAASMVDVETNLDIGEQQLRDAQKLYPKTAEGDNVAFKVKVMDWEARGKIWAAMEKAEGIDFKDLEQPYKKAAAKAVFTMEMANMLSGQRFDADRHAGQYKFDTKTNTIGVFDTGSVSIVEPTEKEKKVLGIVLANTVKTLMDGDGNNVASAFCTEIDKGIVAFYKKEIEEGKPIPPYLSEFQRGLLALTDFHKEIPAQELGVCLMQALNNGKHQLDKGIYDGFTAAMLDKPQKSEEIAVSPHIRISPELAGAYAQSVVSSALVFGKEDVMTKEARFARDFGHLVGGKIAEEGGLYDLITHLPTDMKTEEALDILQSNEGMHSFGKGVIRGVLSKMDPKNYSVEEKRQVGALLHKVIEQGARQKKLHQEVSLPQIFEEMAAKEPKLGKYAQNLLSVAKIATKFDMTTDVEVFKKAVILGRLTDKEVQNGYMEALRKSPDSSFIKKTLSHVNPLHFVPQKHARKIVKFMMKKVAPKCGEKVFQMTRNTMNDKGQSHA